MKSICRVTKLVLIFLVVMFGFVAAAEEEKASSGQTVKQTKLTDIESLNPNYVPPPGAKPMPGKRLGKGGSRSGSQKFPDFQLLVPEHQIVTYLEQPTLYWELAESTDSGAVVQVTPLNMYGAEKGLRRVVAGPLKSGIHNFDLSEHEFELVDGFYYEWSVSICKDKLCAEQKEIPSAYIICKKEKIGKERNDWFHQIGKIVLTKAN